MLNFLLLLQKSRSSTRHVLVYKVITFDKEELYEQITSVNRKQKMNMAKVPAAVPVVKGISGKQVSYGSRHKILIFLPLSSLPSSENFCDSRIAEIVGITI